MALPINMSMTMTMDVMTALYKLEGEKQFDYIFMDPPYGKEWEKKVLAYLAGSDLIADKGVVIVEASLETDLEYVGDLGKPKCIRQISMCFSHHRGGKRYVKGDISGKF